jgi:RimJ/RimL family protein N-acetyltransferase
MPLGAVGGWTASQSRDWRGAGRPGHLVKTPAPLSLRYSRPDAYEASSIVPKRPQQRCVAACRTPPLRANRRSGYPESSNATDPGSWQGHAKLDDMAQPTLHTERLRLVPLADEHLQFEVELDSDPEVMRYLTGRALLPGEVEQAHRRRLAAADEVPGLGFWAGFADEEFVGWWILQPPHGPDQPRVAGEADLGYRLLRRHWRRGYASEGARELIRYGFEDVCLNRIFAQTMAVNAASRATLAAVGLTFTRAFVSDEPYDDLVAGAEQGEVEYELTKSTWRHRGRR